MMKTCEGGHAPTDRCLRRCWCSLGGGPARGQTGGGHVDEPSAPRREQTSGTTAERARARRRAPAQREGDALLPQRHAALGPQPGLGPACPGLIALPGSPPGSATWRGGSAGSWFLTVGLYVVLYLAIVFVIDLPLAYYEGFVRQHAYGLSNQTLAKWLGDSLKGLAVEMAVGFAFAWVPYLLLARAPRRWWLYTALLSVPFLFVTVLVKPIWIDPLFNDFGPMKNKALERSILDLASRAGIEGSRVFEVDKSVDTNAVNAYVTGVFGTKRIVLWDTLIARLDEKELLFVMAHEMGHYVLGHVVRSILLSVVRHPGGPLLRRPLWAVADRPFCSLASASTASPTSPRCPWCSC